MRQRINIYISKPALEELDKLAREEGKSRGAVMEGLVLGAKGIEARLTALESAARRSRTGTAAGEAIKDHTHE